LLASAARASGGSAPVKNPPRQSDDTRSPASATSRRASSKPISASCSRQIPIALRPASTQPSTASGSDQDAVVRWLSESRDSSAPVVIERRRRWRVAGQDDEPRDPDL